MPWADHVRQSWSKKVSSWHPQRILLLSVLVATCLVGAISILLIRTPFQIDYGEGLMMEGALRIRYSQPLYPDPFEFPVVLHEYGPVAYAVLASVLPSQGISFTAGRCLIIGCSLVISVLLGSLVQRGTGSVCLGISFGVLFLTVPTFRFWFYFIRSDLIGLLFSMIGVTFYLSWKRPYSSIPFFALALFCKFTLLAAPLAVFVHLVLQRKTRQGIIFLAGLGIACLLPLGVLQISTRHWFVFHMFSIHADPYSLQHYVGMAGLVAVTAPVVTALAIWYVLRSLRFRQPSFPAAYLAMSLITALTAGKVGATTNHFIEWMLASCLCAGLGYAELLRRHPIGAVPVTIVLSASVLAGVVMQQSQPSRAFAECGKSYEYVKNSSSDRVFADSVGPLLVAGKPVLISDPFAYGQLLKHGSWPDRSLERRLNERYFGLIVMEKDPVRLQLLGSDVWPDSVITAINRNYRTVARFNCRYTDVILEPKP